MSLLLRLPRGSAYNQLVSTRNYTGDVLNFGLAKENYAASHPDKIDRLKFVIVGDDVSVGRAQGSIVGRRGLAGTVLVYKIAGALAGRGASLDEVYNVAQWVSTRLGTIGVGLEHCHASALYPLLQNALINWGRIIGTGNGALNFTSLID